MSRCKCCEQTYGAQPRKPREARDLSQGSIARGIAAFALPLLGTSMVQLMYSMVDALFAGNVLGVDAIAAIGSSSLAAICLVSFFSGLSVGANVLVANRFGAKDFKGISSAALTAIFVSVIGGICVAAVGFAISPALSSAMLVPQNVFSASTLYLQIYFLSVPFIVTYNMVAGVFRGMGDSKTPLMVQVIGGAANIALDALFLLAFNFGIAGIAWATFIAQGLACAIVLVLLFASSERCICLKGSHLDFACLRYILRVGFPCALQSMFVTLSNVFVQSAINASGSAGIAAFTAYFKLEMFIYEPVIAIGQAATVFNAQNIGAKKHARIHRGIKCCLAMACGIAICISMALLVFSNLAFSMFSSDAEVVQLGASIFAVSLPFYWLYAFVEIYAGASRGAEHAAVPMAIILVCYALGRVALLYATPLASYGVSGIAAVFPITWGVAAVLMFSYYRFSVHPKLHSKIAQDKLEEIHNKAQLLEDSFDLQRDTQHEAPCYLSVSNVASASGVKTE